MKKLVNIFVTTVFIGLAAVLPAQAISLDEMKTPAEASNYTRTSSSQEVIDFCKEVAKQSGGRIRVDHIGYSPMGKEMIVLVMGNPAPKGPEEVGGDKVVCYLNNNIHSGEIEGKEASLILAREIAQGKHDKILKDVVIVLNPNHNLDGNDMLGEHRIDSQPEPRLVGSRLTSQGLNLNRDFTKLEQPETKAIMKVIKRWQPSLILDAHATDGSRIRHAVTYHWSYNANTDKELADFNSKVFIPAAMGKGSMLDVKYGRTTRPYGNFFKPGEDWEVDDPNGGYWSKTADEDLPRYAFNYVGLRKMVSVLLECYSWDPYKTRVETQYACIYGTIAALSKHKDEVKNFVRKLNEKESNREKNGLNGEMVVLTTSRDVTEMISIDSYEYSGPWSAELDKPKTYELKHLSTFTPITERYLPAYYFIPEGYFNVIDNLLLHDVEVSRLKGDVNVMVNEFKNFDHEIDPDFGYYEGHTRRLLTSGDWVESEKTILAGTYVVTTSQRNGMLAAVLLEPESNDGLASWNYFDTGIAGRKASRVYPVLKSLTDYAAIDKSNLEKVTETPLEWGPPVQSAVNGGSSSGCNAMAAGAAAAASVIFCGLFIWRRRNTDKS